MKDKLVLREYRGVIVITWKLGKEQGWGCDLGDDADFALDLATISADNKEYWSAEMAFRNWTKQHVKDRGVLWDYREGAAVFMSNDAAKSALSFVKKQMKIILEDKPWPEWAKIALDHGWKPPKKWKP